MMLPRIIRLRLAAVRPCVPIAASIPQCASRAWQSSASQKVSDVPVDEYEPDAAGLVSDTRPSSSGGGMPPLPSLLDTAPSDPRHSPSFPLYPTISTPHAGPSRLSAQEAHEADLALLQSYAKGRGQGKGKGKAVRNMTDLPPDHALLQEAKRRMTDRMIADIPEYTEEELREFYVAVVQSASEGSLEHGPERRKRIGAGAGISVGRVGDGSTALDNAEVDVWANGLQDLDARKVQEVLSGALERLSGHEDTSTPADQLPSGATSAEMQEHRRDPGAAVLAVLQRVLAEGLGEGIAGGSEDAGPVAEVRLGLLSRTEWKAVLADRIHHADFDGIVQTLRYMERSTVGIEPVSLLGSLLRHSSDMLVGVNHQRRPEAAFSVNERLADLLGAQEPSNLSASDHTALLSSFQLDPRSPSRAISHLSRCAATGHPAPQAAYNQLLTSLTTSHPSAPRRALAWDVFHDMRLTAHPTPSLEVYATMLRACAAAAEPKPEVARDLWVEMNQSYSSASSGLISELKGDQGDGVPSVREYTAFIKALGSTKGTYLEAFEVMRQMLAKHDEATYVPFEHERKADHGGDVGSGKRAMSRWAPTKDTWKALLEGTKRAGDVERSKWVLLEAARWVERTGEEMVDEDMVASVLMAYAAFTPKRTRVDVAVKARDVETAIAQDKGQGGESSHGTQHDSDQTAADSHAIQPQQGSGSAAGFQATLTAAQAIAEARGVFDLVRSRSIREMRAEVQHDAGTDVAPPSDTFSITPRLVNSFLSVIYAHAPSIEACRAEWDAVWADVATTEARPNGWSYMHALERCAVGQRHLSSTDAKHERVQALAWAKSLWKGYTSAFPAFTPTLDSLSRPEVYNAGLGPRQIERCWVSIIRAHALSDDVHTALSLLLEFKRLYPPHLITDLYVPRVPHSELKMRFTDPTTVAEADVAPHVIWKDIDVLHHRMIRDGTTRGMGKVKMVSMGYLRALRERSAWRRAEVLGKKRKRGKVLDLRDGQDGQDGRG